MATQKLQGFKGFFYFQVGAGQKQKLASFAGYELSIKAAEIDATDHDNVGWSDKLDGYKDWSATIDSMTLLDAAASTDETTQAALLAALLGSEDVLCEFRLTDVVGAANRTGTARITDYKETAKGSTVQAKNLTLSGRGPLAFGVVAAPSA